MAALNPKVNRRFATPSTPKEPGSELPEFGTFFPPEKRKPFVAKPAPSTIGDPQYFYDISRFDKYFMHWQTNQGKEMDDFMRTVFISPPVSQKTTRDFMRT